jgi:hypothetical protein
VSAGPSKRTPESAQTLVKLGVKFRHFLGSVLGCPPDPQNGPQKVLKLWSNLGSSFEHFRDVQNVSPNTPPGHPKTGCPEGYFRRLPNRPQTRSIRTPQTGVSGGGVWGVQFEVRRTGRSGHRFGEHVLRARGQAWSSLMSRHQEESIKSSKVHHSSNFGRKPTHKQLRLGEQ